MIRAEIEEPRISERDDLQGPTVLVQRVLIEFDAAPEFALPVLQAMLGHLNEELT